MDDIMNVIIGLFAFVTLVLVSLFIIIITFCAVYMVAGYSFLLNENSPFAANISLIFGMGTIIYMLSATAAIISKTKGE